MPLQLSVLIGPRASDAGGDAGAAARLTQTLDGLAGAGVLEWAAVAPATEARLREQLASRPCDILHLLVEATAPGAGYCTVRLLDARGAPRSVNAQALAQLMRQAAPDASLVLLSVFGADAASVSAAVATAWVAKGLAAVVTTGSGGTAPFPAIDAFYRQLAEGATVGEAAALANRTALAETLFIHGRGDLRVVPLVASSGAGAPAMPAARRVPSPAAPIVAPAPAVAAADPIAELLRTKRQAGRFDVFLCHNSADKAAVKRLGQRLKASGILPWLDEWELPPGQPWQELLEQQIQRIGSAAVCIGAAGISPWHQQEMRGFISEFVDRRAPVIPVLLPDAPAQPELPLFLRQMTWVDFRRTDPDPFERLVWGITQRRRDEA